MRQFCEGEQEGGPKTKQKVLLCLLDERHWVKNNWHIQLHMMVMMWVWVKERERQTERERENKRENKKERERWAK